MHLISLLLDMGLFPFFLFLFFGFGSMAQDGTHPSWIVARAVGFLRFSIPTHIHAGMHACISYRYILLYAYLPRTHIYWTYTHHITYERVSVGSFVSIYLLGTS
ncbi:hypothetical protein F5B21DRAFT_240481 [Xylaria acuta]|nr:hypothetical protein F5B21DRAFT_240481 [Xylaria acuta]